ncbi:hypothetical protein EDI_074170 [Entamoeba dispar SAW760]|uniref:Uncharacterized protein n=1 Tax=Entamoeba dispar (strain ATCC PRA-260 / SAW760) TaxID=370354 RepID=B0EGB8_ENTDS|nr:uncharacterized protein EDI_074170 [Entamoeba dispar SAW760]EDR26420.1 hypothetical protein EDI_074170 [Entamoeba dispar SAW760]|eukprot:EDR26420.1 hypothetical protein EDI_074170 [Entamoeba dispar SAW760]
MSRPRSKTFSSNVKITRHFKDNPIVIESDYVQLRRNIPINTIQSDDIQPQEHQPIVSINLDQLIRPNYESDEQLSRNSNNSKPYGKARISNSSRKSLLDSLIQNYDSDEMSVVQQLNILQKHPFSFKGHSLSSIKQWKEQCILSY